MMESARDCIHSLLALKQMMIHGSGVALGFDYHPVEVRHVLFPGGCMPDHKSHRIVLWRVSYTPTTMQHMINLPRRTSRSRGRSCSCSLEPSLFAVLGLEEAFVVLELK